MLLQYVDIGIESPRPPYILLSISLSLFLFLYLIISILLLISRSIPYPAISKTFPQHHYYASQQISVKTDYFSNRTVVKWALAPNWNRALTKRAVASGRRKAQPIGDGMHEATNVGPGIPRNIFTQKEINACLIIKSIVSLLQNSHQGRIMRKPTKSL